MSADTPHGFTVLDLARRWRVGPDKVRGWITRGELPAISTASTLCGRPRYVVLPEAVADWERRRSAAPPPKPARRAKRPNQVDFYPD